MPSGQRVGTAARAIMASGVALGVVYRVTRWLYAYHAPAKARRVCVRVVAQRLWAFCA
jgi:hypothetical protein